MKVRRRYHLLRFIAGAIRLLGWLSLFAAIAVTVLLWTGIANSAQLPPTARWIGTGMMLVSGLIWWVQLIAIGSVLSLLIDIEEDTRALSALPPA
jgi:hypothetical protein